MERTEFEALRDNPAKVIEGDLRLARSPRTEPLLTIEDVRIAGTSEDLRLNITFNPEIRRLAINVHARGRGSICRLCVNGRAHKDAGRTHKHDVVDAGCVANNLPTATPRADLLGKSVADVWQSFCAAAKISHGGALSCEGVDLSQVIL